jgi:hypothetical protein
VTVIKIKPYRKTDSPTCRRSMRLFLILTLPFTSHSAAPRPAVKSAFYVTNPVRTHYAKLHAVLTDYSPLHVALFTDRATATKWLGVPLEALSE